MPKAEKKNYSNVEKELLGVIFRMERLHHQTHGRTITLETDREPLVSIWKKFIATTSPQPQRLLLRLARYDGDQPSLVTLMRDLSTLLFIVACFSSHSLNSLTRAVLDIWCTGMTSIVSVLLSEFLTSVSGLTKC